MSKVVMRSFQVGAMGLVMLFSFANAIAQERDPTRPQTFRPQTDDPESQASSSELELGMITYSATKRWALINNESVEEGASVAGWTVLRIEPTQVFLSRGAEQLRLTVFGQTRLTETRENT